MSNTIVSLFTGAGGIDEGFHQAGFRTVFATDNWTIACETFALNNPGAEVKCVDVAAVDFRTIKKKYGPIKGLVGGPPCPPFSKSRFYRSEKKRGIDDVDGFLTVSNYFRAVEEIKPEFFFFENVAGFVYKPHREALTLVENEAARLGYVISWEVINTADYGVPQIRQRFICVGLKKKYGAFTFPSPTHAEQPSKSSGLLPWTTAGDVINDLDIPHPDDVKNEAGSKHKHLLKLVPPGENYLYFTAERGHPKPEFKWRSRYWSFLLKLSPEKPSWTIQASHSNNMGPFHWRNRFLRIAEIKRLQTFPDGYKLLGSFRDQWRLVGNAVPPKLARVVAESILLHLNKH